MPCHEKLVGQVNVGYLLQAGHSLLGSEGSQTGRVCKPLLWKSDPRTKRLVLVECATWGREKDHINGINSLGSFFTALLRYNSFINTTYLKHTTQCSLLDIITELCIQDNFGTFPLPQKETSYPFPPNPPHPRQLICLQLICILWILHVSGTI